MPSRNCSTTTSFAAQLRELLEVCSDIQRLTTRVSTARASPKELAAIARTLRKLPAVKAKLGRETISSVQDLEQRLELCPDVRELLDSALTDDPPHVAKDGGVIKAGYNAELDELRTLTSEGKNWIARYQAQEITRTGISSLKVGFNQVAGYYIEITQRQRRQGAARLRAQGDAQERRALHHARPQGIRGEGPERGGQEPGAGTATVPPGARQVAAQTPRLLHAAEVLATVDFLAALAELAPRCAITSAPNSLPEPTLDIRGWPPPGARSACCRPAPSCPTT